MIAKLISWI